MPTYEYRCDKCQTVFEVFQSIKASALRRAKCESCGKVMPVKRLIGPGGAVLFKGSGFYQTDYRSESYHKAAKADTAEVKSSSTDAKPDSTAKPADAAANTVAKTEAGSPGKQTPSTTGGGHSKQSSVSSHGSKPASSKPATRAPRRRK